MTDPASPGGPMLSVRGEALLGGSGDGAIAFRSTSARMALPAGGDSGEPDAPSLDPVPQELSATIEARFTATGVSLPAPDAPAGR
jgi:hypothetical protein